jgi:hypothetical protein
VVGVAVVVEAVARHQQPRLHILLMILFKALAIPVQEQEVQPQRVLPAQMDHSTTFLDKAVHLT